MQDTSVNFGNGYRFDQYLYWVWSLLLSVFAVVYWKPISGYKGVEKKSTLPLNLDPNQKSVASSAEIKKSENAPVGYVELLAKSFIPRFLQIQPSRKKLVLDLDETLISSSVKHSSKHDIAVKVSIGGVSSSFYIRKRPHVDHFLETVSQWYEVIVFTASLGPYANAVIDQLDPNRRITKRYYRQSCVNRAGCYVKDLKTVCRDLSKVIIIDNSPVAYSLNQENAIPIIDYVGSNPNDTELLNLIPFLDELRHSADVREVLKTAPNGAFSPKNTRKSNIC